jgi:hypothetical protein
VISFENAIVKTEFLMTKSRGKVRVGIVIEPPMRWPLWFGNEIFDQEELTPISTDLKQDCRELCDFFIANTVWGGDFIGYLWRDATKKMDFNVLLRNLKTNLSNELGNGYYLDDKISDLDIKQ